MKRFKPLHMLPVSACAACVAATLAGCATSECDDLRNTLPIAGFYSSAPTPAPISIPSLTLYGMDAPEDSVLLESATSVSKAYLPFRIDCGTTSFVLDYLTESLRDTITFIYDISPRFASAECGVVYYYTPTSITHSHTLIDSVTCPAKIITNTPGENLRIYFKNLPLK